MTFDPDQDSSPKYIYMILTEHVLLNKWIIAWCNAKCEGQKTEEAKMEQTDTFLLD